MQNIFIFQIFLYFVYFFARICYILWSANPYSGHRFVLAEVLSQRHRLLHNFLVNTRCVEQVQTVFVPHGKSYVLRVQSLYVRQYAYYVAVVHTLSQQLGVLYLRLGNIPVFLAVYLLL